MFLAKHAKERKERKGFFQTNRKYIVHKFFAYLALLSVLCGQPPRHLVFTRYSNRNSGISRTIIKKPFPLVLYHTLNKTYMINLPIDFIRLIRFHKITIRPLQYSSRIVFIQQNITSSISAFRQTTIPN